MSYARPYYETESDLATEQDMMRSLCEGKGYSWRKLPLTYKADFVVHQNNQIISFVECRKRSNASNKYPTLIVSLQKVVTIRELAKACNVPAYILAGFTDGLFLLDMAQEFKTSIGGHQNRGDWQDIEIVAHFDLQNAKRFAAIPPQ